MRGIIFVVTLCISASAVFAASDANPGCVDENGDAVDWYVIYKLPREGGRHERTDNDLINDGTAFAFFTAKDKRWRLSKLSIGDMVNFVL